jgi:hypothetical protein
MRADHAHTERSCRSFYKQSVLHTPSISRPLLQYYYTYCIKAHRKSSSTLLHYCYYRSAQPVAARRARYHTVLCAVPAAQHYPPHKYQTTLTTLLQSCCYCFDTVTYAHALRAARTLCKSLIVRFTLLLLLLLLLLLI